MIRAESHDDLDREPSREKSSTEREPDQRRKAFQPPELTRHASLPEVTTGFAASFTP